MYRAEKTLTDNLCKSFYKRWLERGGGTGASFIFLVVSRAQVPFLSDYAGVYKKAMQFWAVSDILLSPHIIK